MDKFLQVAVGVGVLMAASGYFYQNVFHKPAADSEERAEEVEERQVGRALYESEVVEREAERDHQASDDQARRVAYQQCLDAAEERYQQQWTANCERKAADRRVLLESCLNDPVFIKHYGAEQCHSTHGADEPTRDCALDTEIGRILMNDLQREKNRCTDAAALDL